MHLCAQQRRLERCAKQGGVAQGGIKGWAYRDPRDRSHCHPLMRSHTLRCPHLRRKAVCHTECVIVIVTALLPLCHPHDTTRSSDGPPVAGSTPRKVASREAAPNAGGQAGWAESDGREARGELIGVTLSLLL